MLRPLLSAAAALAIFSSIVAAEDGAACNPSKPCQESTPCCSQYGKCGVGAYCLGGCDPLSSFSLKSCMPNPTCKSQDFEFTGTDGMAPNTEYLGDASKADFVTSGQPRGYKDDNGDQLILTMPQNSVGTLIASNHYVWYGKITAKLKTSRGAGVVSAFILLSDAKDEIDFEFVGTDLQNAQTNYYFQGITDYTHGKNISIPDLNTFADYHTYEIDWKPDQITWSIDGNPLRTVKKSDTFNKTANRYDYPQTPSRVQLSLWPAGLSTNGKGTVDWAGGLVNWNDPDVKNAGYFYSMYKELKIECYDPPSNAKKSGDKSYTYTNKKGDEGSIAMGDDDTVLGSFQASGLDPDKGKQTSNSDPKNTAPSVPGLDGVGVRGGETGAGDDGSSSGSGTSSDSGSGSGSADAPQSTNSGFHGFSQNGQNSASNLQGEKVLKGSMLAVTLAIVALVAI